MMNKIYDFDSIYAIRKEQKRLIILFLLFCLCFGAALAIVCALIKNTVLLAAVFALLLLVFLSASVLFWRIKYAILRDYLTFLDNMETGDRRDFVGVFHSKSSALQGAEPFDSYTFDIGDKKHIFLVHASHTVPFAKGKKYRVECVGSYIYQWQIIE